MLRETASRSRLSGRLAPGNTGANPDICTSGQHHRADLRHHAVSKAGPRAGLEGVRLHDLRHACASFLLAAGASPRTVMKTLGHSQIGLTMNTYAHVLPEIERAAIEAAARAIFE